MGFDKELLFKSRLPEADVEVPGVGTIRVRGLSRDEALRVRGTSDVATIERRMIALGCVDPVLTEDEVKRWQMACPAGELEPITATITELSGMMEGAAKEAYREFDADSDAEFRVLPGPEAGDDSGSPEG